MRERIAQVTEKVGSVSRAAINGTATFVLFDAVVVASTNTWSERVALGVGALSGYGVHELIGFGDKAQLPGVGSAKMQGMVTFLGTIGALVCASTGGPKEAIEGLATGVAVNILINPLKRRYHRRKIKGNQENSQEESTADSFDYPFKSPEWRPGRKN